ncbi:hypothetical protein EDD22DRAFT_846263 [Suillus occidentalis]|nr:hypothetical protein EDD22DRAFT_846263 [Suillus occidentalis]
MLFPSSIILMEAVNTASTAVDSFRSRRGPVITSVDPVPAEQVGSSGLGGLDNLANGGQDHFYLYLTHVIGIVEQDQAELLPLIEPDGIICTTYQKRSDYQKDYHYWSKTNEVLLLPSNLASPGKQFVFPKLRPHIPCITAPNNGTPRRRLDNGSWHWCDTGLRLFNEYGRDIVGRKSLHPVGDIVFGGDLFLGLRGGYNNLVCGPLEKYRI